MRRREFIALGGASGTALVLPRVALAQQSPKAPRIAWLSTPLDPGILNALRLGLADLGYVEGKNLVLDVFTAPTNADLPEFAARIVAAKPDVIATFGTAPAQALKAATATIPVVFLSSADPVGAGIVSSLAHPGANITGLSSSSPDLVGLHIQMIKELVPGLQRLAVLTFPEPAATFQVPLVEAAAQKFNFVPVFIEFAAGQDVAPQFERVPAAQVQAAYVLALTYFAQPGVRDAAFDLSRKLPLVAALSVVDGDALPAVGLVDHAPDRYSMIRERGAPTVVAILNGARPADLPVEQPTTFTMALNLDTARRLGISVPQSILSRATLVIDYDLRAPKVAK